MTKKERENYGALLKEHDLRFYKDDVWTTALMKLIPYRSSHFASISSLKYIDTTNVHVGANFIGCGRQDFMVKYQNSFYFH